MGDRCRVSGVRCQVSGVGCLGAMPGHLATNSAEDLTVSLAASLVVARVLPTLGLIAIVGAVAGTLGYLRVG